MALLSVLVFFVDFVVLVARGPGAEEAGSMKRKGAETQSREGEGVGPEREC